MHILNFQRDIVVGWIIHIELKVPLLGRVQEFYGYICYIYTRKSKKKPNLFNLNLLLHLQPNQTCLLQSTPLYCWYTAPSVFSSSGTRPGTYFAGLREGPVANFLLSTLASEIGDLLGWTSTLGTGKSPQGPNLESRGAGARKPCLASPKIHG